MTATAARRARRRGREVPLQAKVDRAALETVFPATVVPTAAVLPVKRVRLLAAAAAPLGTAPLARAKVVRRELLAPEDRAALRRPVPVISASRSARPRL